MAIRDALQRLSLLIRLVGGSGRGKKWQIAAHDARERWGAAATQHLAPHRSFLGVDWGVFQPARFLATSSGALRAVRCRCRRYRLLVATCCVFPPPRAGEERGIQTTTAPAGASAAARNTHHPPRARGDHYLYGYYDGTTPTTRGGARCCACGGAAATMAARAIYTVYSTVYSVCTGTFT